MPSNYTPLAPGQFATAVNFNAPLEQLDTAIEQVRNQNKGFEARLSGNINLPVVGSNLTAITTLYLHRFRGNNVLLWNGSRFTGYQFASSTPLSLSLSGYTANSNYDIFLDYNAGSPVLRSLIWTNNTTRQTTIDTLIEGIYLLSGTPAWRYVGTIRIGATTGQTEDSETHRFIYNYYNRIRRHFRVVGSSNHNYNSGTVRSWNNDATLRYDFVVGVAEDSLRIDARGQNTGVTSNTICSIGAGYDSTSINNLDIDGFTYPNAMVDVIGGEIKIIPAAGYHFVQAVQTGATTSCQFNTIRLGGEIML